MIIITRQIKGTLNHWKQAFPVSETVWDNIILRIFCDFNKEKYMNSTTNLWPSPKFQFLAIQLMYPLVSTKHSWYEYFIHTFEFMNLFPKDISPNYSWFQTFTVVNVVFFLLGDSLASEFYVPRFRTFCPFHLHTSCEQEQFLFMRHKKHRHIEFRCWEITQMKEYNIQIMSGRKVMLTRLNSH